MSERRVAPYGSWRSPISSDLIVRGVVGLSQVRADRGAVHWMESRPGEAGRNVIVRRTADGSTEDVTPRPFNARTRVHEYGGGDFAVHDDTVYFSSGGKGSQAILSAVDVRTGKVQWQQRSIQKATFVWADGKLITLDQDGNLMIAHPSPEGFRISAQAPLMSHLSWTPPVLVGTRLYLRDRRDLMAVDLG